MDRYFTELATAFVRGRLDQSQATIETGLQAGLRLHKFKQNGELPRVRSVLGILRNLQPENLLDIGSGRGAFLRPLAAALPALQITATDITEQRSNDLAALRKGGVKRLTVVRADVHHLPFAPHSFDVVTMLEVLENLPAPQQALSEVIRSARRLVVISVPSTPDENPEHLHLFGIQQLKDMAAEAGAVRTTFEHVLNHRIMLAHLQ